MQGQHYRIGPPSGTAGDPSVADVTAVITANCRYGLTGGEPYASWLAGQNLGLGAYLDFGAHPDTATLPGADYFKLVRVKQNRQLNGNGTYDYLSTYTLSPSLSAIASYARTSPGSLWLVGNEPDRGPDSPTDANRVQDDTYPDIYARAYHDVYAEIKNADPTAQVAIAGLVEVTPGRLSYLDLVWQTYQSLYGVTPPVDVFNVHAYMLPETYVDNGVLKANNIASVAKGTRPELGKLTFIGVVGTAAQAYCSDDAYYCTHDHGDVNEFAKQIVAMRTWMKAKGQQNKPLIITEFGLLYPYQIITDPASPWYPYGCFLPDEWGNCFTPQRAAQYLQDTFNYLNTASDPNLGYPADNNRLVQQWLWYDMFLSGSVLQASIMDPGGSQSFAPAGNALKSMVTDPAKFPQTLNFVATQAQPGAQYPAVNGIGFDVNVGVLNNGSIQPAAPVVVTVYSNAARTQVIGSATIRGVRGCARREYQVKVPARVPVGTRGQFNYYVTVDPGNVAGETSMADNYQQGSINITIQQVLQFYLPLIMR
ncbi:MAG: hypothetical protein HZB53_12380 [Chloroflexi bacterium]|nr:hypothetical protein [Chloroflexota bacterium]